MTLSSQAPRSGLSRSHMYRKRRSKKWPILALLIAGLGITGLLIFTSGGGRQDKQSAPTSSDPSNPNTTDASSGQQANLGGSTDVIEDPNRTLTFKQNTPANLPGISNTPNTPARPNAAPNLATNNNPNRPTRPDVVSPVNNTGSNSTATNTPVNTSPNTSLKTPRSTSFTGPAAERFAYGKRLMEQQKLVEARRVLSDLLFTPPSQLSDDLADDIRIELNRINRTLIFSPTVVAEDNLITVYKVKSGDRLSKIAPKFGLTAKLVAEINGIDPNRIRVGQPLKILNGPLHARVTKRRYIMDIYAEDNQRQAVYVQSFPVGLGTDDSTPIGSWRVQPGRKAINPDWRDDRTGEYFASNDPENPIGEYWLALEGTDAATAARKGYGIHGTIDPESIGTMASRGCIRLRDEDIKAVYYLLVEGRSTVHVLP